MLPSITFLDLETTGTTPLRDRITEIALVRFDHGVETARWQTLVNPEMPIPPFIQSLTGIHDAMVANAPTFAGVAEQLLRLLEGTVLAAHNVRFDHGFLKAEFRRIGITLQQKVLCTVKLSRLLYPQYYSHGIDAIVQRHNIEGLARHRAMGDVEAVLRMLEDARQQLGETALQAAAEKLMAVPALPAHIDAHLVGELPEAPGVYIFHGRQDEPIYIGKGLNVRAKVLAHFSSAASAREKRMVEEMKRFEWLPVAGELSAALLHAHLVKTHQPVYNRQYQERQFFSWQVGQPGEPPLARLVAAEELVPGLLGQVFGTFKSKRQATEAFRKIADQCGLCLKVLGLELDTSPACSAYRIRRCKGACCGGESLEIHALRLQQALLPHRLKAWPYAGKIGIEEYSADHQLHQVHVFEHWTYLGVASDNEGLQDLREQATLQTFSLDTYQLLLKILQQKKTRVLDLAHASDNAARFADTGQWLP